MELNEPATKRLKLDRKCKAVRSDDLPRKPSRNTVKRKNAAANKTANQSMSTESDVSSEIKPKMLTDLNVSCLLDIIGQLDLTDLCTMAEVCVDLKKVAVKAFSIKYRKLLRLQSLVIPNAQTGTYQTCTLVKILRFFYHFGHFVRYLTIQFNQLGSMRYDKLLLLIRKYCSPTIRAVEIVGEPNEDGDYLNCIGDIFLDGHFAAISDGRSNTIYRNQRRQKHNKSAGLSTTP